MRTNSTDTSVYYLFDLPLCLHSLSWCKSWVESQPENCLRQKVVTQATHSNAETCPLQFKFNIIQHHFRFFVTVTELGVVSDPANLKSIWFPSQRSDIYIAAYLGEPAQQKDLKAMKTAAFCESYNHNNHIYSGTVLYPIGIQRSPGKVMFFRMISKSKHLSWCSAAWPKCSRQPCGGHHTPRGVLRMTRPFWVLWRVLPQTLKDCWQPYKVDLLLFSIIMTRELTFYHHNNKYIKHPYLN